MILRLHTLGGFALQADGIPLSERGAQPVRAALLIVVALERELRRERIQALLWPERDGERARHALRQTLYALRQDLGDDWVDSDRDVIRAASTLQADVLDLLDAADRDDHERVVHLYGGPFLDGVHLASTNPFETWCDQWRARLDRLHRTSRRALIEAGVASGDLAGALRHAEDWLAHDPLENEAHHRVIEVLFRLGRGNEALGHYERYKALLTREELRPLDATEDLVATIRLEGPGLPPLGETQVGGDLRLPALEVAEGTAAGRTADGATHPAPTAGTSLMRVLTRLAGVAVLGAATVVLLRGRVEPSVRALSPERVMVAPPTNLTGDSTLDVLGHLAADHITLRIAQTGLLRPVPPLDVVQMLRAGLPVETAATRRGAGTIISGEYFSMEGSVELHVRITDARRGETWYVLEPVRLDPAAPNAPIEKLSEGVAGALAARLTPESALPPPSLLRPPTYPALKAFMDAAPHVVDGDWAGAIPYLQRAVELDSTFVRAELAIGAAYWNLGQYARADSVLDDIALKRDGLALYERVVLGYGRASLRGDWSGRLDMARQAARLDPGGTVHYLSARTALAAGRPREAIRLYGNLDLDIPWAPGSMQTWESLTGAHHVLGDLGGELEVALRARSLYPGRLPALYLEVRALVGKGHLDAARSRLRDAATMGAEPGWTHGRVLWNTAAEMRVHGHEAVAEEALTSSLNWYETLPETERSSDANLGGYARASFLAGRLAAADSIAGILLARHPDDVALIGFAGAVAARLGRHESVRAAEAALASLQRPYLFGGPSYWRAVVAAWSGDGPGAISLLRRAFGEGHARGISLHADPMLETLWKHPSFRWLVADET